MAATEGLLFHFGRLAKCFSVDLESGIQRKDINVTAGAWLARKVCVLQYDINRGLRLPIRNNQVDPQTRLLTFNCPDSPDC
jgi:hypothetical protein